jgi:hypothetical protein
VTETSDFGGQKERLINRLRNNLEIALIVCCLAFCAYAVGEAVHDLLVDALRLL